MNVFQETEDEYLQRLGSAQLMQAQSRATENDEQRIQPQEADQVAHEQARESENCQQRRHRQQKDRNAKSDATVCKNIAWFKAAFSYNHAKDYRSNTKVTIGKMNKICQHCSAMKWTGEAPGMCCKGGKVKLEILQAPPDVLQKLLTEDSSNAKHFREKIWKYNAAFMMTSFGADKDLTQRGFFTTYKIQGQCYHRMGSLLPLQDEEPKFVQVFFMGGDEEASQRCRLNQGVEQDIIRRLQAMLHDTHPYVASFKFALEQMETPNHKVVIKADRRPAGEHARRFNAPVANEVAILMVGEEHGKRDIVLKQRDNLLMSINETHRSYDSLQYPLMFPRGEDGYNFALRQVNPSTGQETNKSVSCRDFYAYRLMVRNGEFNQLLRFKEVTSQLLVDMYAKIETERLLYIRLNQKQLRAEQYIHLQDAMNVDGNADNIGQQVILPSSFTGSPRYMHQRTQDAMAYVRKFGRPDLFITFTCNPKWEEIQDGLFGGQTRNDRHDLIARVFHEKQKKLIWLLKDGKIFGKLDTSIPGNAGYSQLVIYNLALWS